MPWVTHGQFQNLILEEDTACQEMEVGTQYGHYVHSQDNNHWEGKQTKVGEEEWDRYEEKMRDGEKRRRNKGNWKRNDEKGSKRKNREKKLKELMSPDKIMFSENQGLLWK